MYGTIGIGMPQPTVPSVRFKVVHLLSKSLNLTLTLQGLWKSSHPQDMNIAVTEEFGTPRQSQATSANDHPQTRDVTNTI